MKAIVNIYYIIVNSNQTFIPDSQKKIIKVDALLLTHAVDKEGAFYRGQVSVGIKEAAFQPSTAVPHLAEFVKISSMTATKIL